MFTTPATNKECHHKIGEVWKVKMETQPVAPKTFSLNNLSTDDLESMKNEDPFLYFSIPGVRSAKILGKDIDASDLGYCMLTKRHRISEPSRQESSQDTTEDEIQSIRRRRCISYECHPDLLMEEISEDELDVYMPESRCSID